MRALILFSLLSAACARPVGWWRADKAPTAEDLYDERFESIVLSPEGPCEPVLARQGEAPRPIIVLVPGVGGEGDEMHEAVPLLMKANPASMFMFRYDPFWKVGELTERLAAGISRLAECVPDGVGRIIVLAHSGGGLLSTVAASMVKPPAEAPTDWLTVVTAASPLAGTTRAPSARPLSEQRLMRVLGSNNDIPFPEPVKGVRVVHLRSSAQSDGYMRPSGDHLPNDPKVGSPGAPQIDLPAELNHSQALVFAAKKIGDGSWVEWFAAPAR
ncbi:MAG: hypothetical protein JNK82_25820 [Myxococcaceae bacterium]|nr:hypothetical protein [Myxococcaceae bacterium]